VKKAFLLIMLLILLGTSFGCSSNSDIETQIVGTWGITILDSEVVLETDSDFSTLILNEDKTFELLNYDAGLSESITKDDYEGIFSVTKSTLQLEYYQGDIHGYFSFEITEDSIMKGVYYSNGELAHVVIEFRRMNTNLFDSFVGTWELNTALTESFDQREKYSVLVISEDGSYIIYEDDLEAPILSGETTPRFTKIIFGNSYQNTYAYFEDDQLIVNFRAFYDYYYIYYDFSLYYNKME